MTFLPWSVHWLHCKCSLREWSRVLIQFASSLYLAWINMNTQREAYSITDIKKNAFDIWNEIKLTRPLMSIEDHG